MSEPTKIIPCTCENEYQDEVYGHGKRVANRGGTSSHWHYICTVCGTKQESIVTVYNKEEE